MRSNTIHHYFRTCMTGAAMFGVSVGCDAASDVEDRSAEEQDVAGRVRGPRRGWSYGVPGSGRLAGRQREYAPRPHRRCEVDDRQAAASSGVAHAAS